jgi:ketosteroid isomerase-like protein
MKSQVLVFLLAVGIAFTSNSSELSPQDIKEIKVSSKEWVKAYNQNNWKGLAALFSPGATMMPPNSVAITGRTGIANWQAANESGFRIAFDIQEIEGEGDVAYVRGNSCVFIPDEEGKFRVDVGKFLEIRKKQNTGEWLIQADIFNSDAALGSQLLDSCPFAILE